MGPLLLFQLLLLAVCGPGVSSTGGGLVSNPSAHENGHVIGCPGSSLSLTCTHDNVRSEQTRWEILNYGEAPIPRVASHEPDTDKSESLGLFIFTMISDGSGLTLTSTVEATVTESLNGTEVLCRDGGSSNSTTVGRVTVITAMPPSAPKSVHLSLKLNDINVMWSSAEGNDVNHYGVSIYTFVMDINDKTINHSTVRLSESQPTVNSSSIHAAAFSVVTHCGPAVVTPALLHSGGAVISPLWMIVIIVTVLILSSITLGVICAARCKLFVEGLQKGRSSSILLVTLLVFVFGFGIGLLIGYLCFGRKKTDPTTVDQQTASSGDTNAVVDKQKTELEQTEPDKPTYTDIDVTASPHEPEPAPYPQIPGHIQVQ